MNVQRPRRGVDRTAFWIIVWLRWSSVLVRAHGRRSSGAGAAWRRDRAAAPWRRTLALARARAQPRRAQRMLVIVNPYATTVSDRLKNLVVYALQGRYDVEAVDTEAPRPRDRAVPRGRRRGLRRRRRLRRRRHGQRGRQRPAPARDTPLTCLPGGATNVYCQACSGSPTTSSTPPSTCCAWPTTGAPRARRPRPRQRPPLHVRRRRRARRQRRRARRRHPRLKARFGAVLLHLRRRSRRSCASYVVHPPRLEVEVDGATRRAASPRSSRTASPTRTSATARSTLAEGAALDDGTLAGVVLQPRAPARHARRSLPRLLSGAARIAAHRAIDAFGGVARGRACARPTAAPMPLQVDGDHIGDVTEAALRRRARRAARSSA